MNAKDMKITRLVSLAIFSFLITTWSVGCKPSTKFVSVGGSVLTMREKPDTKGKFIYSIPDRAKVNIIEETGAEIEISGAKGKWTKVSVDKHEGWVFGGFLADKQPAPQPESPKARQKRCMQKCVTDNNGDAYATGQCWSTKCR